MDYFFIPGRISSLSLCELFEVCRSKKLPLTFRATGRTVFLATLPDDTDTRSLFDTLGGMIKYGTWRASLSSLDDALSFISEVVKTNAAYSKKRITFGISSYTISQGTRKENPRDLAFSLQRWGIALKKELVADGASVRFVVSQKGEAALSSVIVEKNHLCEEGNSEWVLIRDNDTWHVGTTSGVQEFEDFSNRDWNRPHRDMRVGLLPPKIARIMVNLSGASTGESVLDPFCGLGTILQEAALLGHSHVFGSDLEQKQIDATKENLEWLACQAPSKGKQGLTQFPPARLWREEGVPGPFPFTLKQCDARAISHCFSKNLFAAIITEPTLGPALSGRHQSVSEKEIDALCNLYIESFYSFHEVLMRAGRVVIVFPVWMTGSQQRHIPCVDTLMKKGFTNITIPDSLRHTLSDVTERDSLVISRPDARVARELFVFERM